MWGHWQIIPSEELTSRIAKIFVGLYHGRSTSLHLPTMGVWTMLEEGEIEERRCYRERQDTGNLCSKPHWMLKYGKHVKGTVASIAKAGKQGHIGVF